MKTLTKKNIIKSLCITATTIGMLNLVACSPDTLPVRKIIPTVSKSETSFKIKQLSEKMKKSEFTIMALNDANFIKDALNNSQSPTSPAVSDTYFQCVYTNIKREKYTKELEEVAEYLVVNYPHDIDAYIIKLDFLIPVVRKMYNHPTPVEFNSRQLESSTALAILSPKDADEMTTTIRDSRYTPLLATIGLPTIKADGTIEDISILQINSLMGYIHEAKGQCQ